MSFGLLAVSCIHPLFAVMGRSAYRKKSELEGELKLRGVLRVSLSKEQRMDY